MKTILYLGTDPTQFESQGHLRGHLIHYPVIKIVPRPLDHPELKQAYGDLDAYTHLLFTSKNSVKVFSGHLTTLNRSLETKVIIAIGVVTAAHLSRLGLSPQFVAQEETQEGVVQLLGTMNLENSYFFMPRSSLSRPILVNFFQQRYIRYQACDLYDTVAQALEPKPNLDEVEEIVFTSPSTVSAFLEIFGSLPKGKKLIAIGPVTEQVLLSRKS
ncbi:MAG: uroporphyrinogen-III synthase [Rhabdochlamydiaceae bacterium]